MSRKWSDVGLCYQGNRAWSCGTLGLWQMLRQGQAKRGDHAGHPMAPHSLTPRWEGLPWASTGAQ